MNETELVKRKLSDLAVSSYEKNIWQYSKFLNLAQQDILSSMKLPVRCSLFGGYDGAERCVAVFGNAEETGYEACPPVVYIEVVPVNEKFSDKLTHRDFLGALMSLGINRDMLGDIVICGNRAVIICLDTVSDLIINELDRIRHTTVRCLLIPEMPEASKPVLSNEELIVSSERTDVLVSGIFNLSRNDSQMLIKNERVFCNNALVRSASSVPTEGQIISVRGYGRFIYDGVIRKTKKNRLIISIRKY